MNAEFNPQAEIKEFLQSRKDEPFLKRPSIYYLKAYADKLLDIANKWQSQSDEMIMPLIKIFRDLDIFKADVDGELKHDYENDLKRYYNKWQAQKAILDSIKQSLLTAYEDSQK